MRLTINLGPNVTLRTTDSNLDRMLANTDSHVVSSLLDNRLEGFNRLEARVNGVDYRVRVSD